MTMMATNGDLNRELGKVIGELAGVKQRLDRIDDVLERIEGKLEVIESRENRRTGGLVVLGSFWTLITLAVGWVVQHYWK